MRTRLVAALVITAAIAGAVPAVTTVVTAASGDSVASAHTSVEARAAIRRY
jgi:hypothetical protein